MPKTNATSTPASDAGVKADVKTETEVAEAEAQAMLDDEQASPMFDKFEDEEDFSEDELLGHGPDAEPAEKKSESSAPEGEEQPKDDDKEKEPEKEGEQSQKQTAETTGLESLLEKSDEDKAKEEAKAEGTKPPEGYVPLAALHEERRRRQELQENLSNLQGKVEVLLNQKEQKEPEEGEKFNELSDAEFKKLREEDPDAAMDYLQALMVNQRKEALHEKEASKVTAEEEKFKAVIDSSWSDLLQQWPKFKDEAPIVVGFVQGELGLSQDSLEILSDPGAIVVKKDGTKAPLGKAATEFVLAMRRAAVVKASVPNEEKLRERIKTELEKEVTERVTGELMKKFKESGASAFGDIGSAPSAGKGSAAKAAPTSETDWAKLSPDDQEKYLRGQDQDIVI